MSIHLIFLFLNKRFLKTEVTRS